MLLSICIPTNGRVSVLARTLDSILTEKIDPEILEVVISDNSDGDDVAELIKKYNGSGLNVVYYKSDEKGYYNLVVALTKANGCFLKLHNDYSSFTPGALTSLLEYVRENQDSKPQTLFSNGNLNTGTCDYFASFDAFLSHTLYWNTWSSAFSMWRSDLELLDTSKNMLDENFPHVSLLFKNIHRTSYCVDDRTFFINQPVAGKGGYNIFKLFCVDYVGMLKGLNVSGSITQRTYKKILNSMRDQFIPRWLQASVYTNNGLTFDNKGYSESIKVNFNGKDYFLIKLRAYMLAAKWYIKQFIKKFRALRI